MAIIKETKLVRSFDVRTALLNKVVAIRGNNEFNTWIQQTREFYHQFQVAPGVVLYPEKKSKTDPYHVHVGLIGHLAGVPIWILPAEEKLPEFYVQYEFDR